MSKSQSRTATTAASPKSEKQQQHGVTVTLTTSSPPYTPPKTGFLSLLPSSWVPYAQLMRLDRPAGLYAFYTPYLMGMAYAACISEQFIRPGRLAQDAVVYLVWCIILRGATCTWNDNIDQDFDRKVVRCRNRPIARGAVSTLQGHVFTLAQMVVGAVFADYFFPGRECAVDIAVMMALYALYPFGKRFTNYPQFILGFPFSAGIIMPCHAYGVNPFSTTQFTSATVSLCVANILWTMIYDTIYAHQDLKDDLKAGVKSMAVRFQHSTKLMCSVLAVGQVGLLIHAGTVLGLSAGYYLVAVAGTAASLVAMIGLVDLMEPSSCAWWFRTDFWLVGGSISAGLFADYAVKRMLV
ncbi:polyprenyl transferase-like protein [Rhypophila decipiens]|uniref:Diterpenoid pyrone biosynthesis cluster protein C n=1 Tax=Rhypophila decipiens TaxID=261697 RepID=A0AAN6YJ44_9PEZI|nr:polyprenyl transferase-like protein [Rhypophila decipiens]